MAFNYKYIDGVGVAACLGLLALMGSQSGNSPHHNLASLQIVPPTPDTRSPKEQFAYRLDRPVNPTKDIMAQTALTGDPFNIIYVCETGKHALVVSMNRPDINPLSNISISFQLGNQNVTTRAPWVPERYPEGQVHDFGARININTSEIPIGIQGTLQNVTAARITVNLIGADGRSREIFRTSSAAITDAARRCDVEAARRGGPAAPAGAPRPAGRAP